MFALLIAATLAAAPASAEREITIASHAFDQAQLTHDRAALDRFLAPDFKFVRGSGKFTGRDEFIASFTDPDVKFDPFQITNRAYVDLGPDAGIVSAEGRITGTDHGKPFSEHFRFADTFRRIAGQWRVVYVQVTPLP